MSVTKDHLEKDQCILENSFAQSTSSNIAEKQALQKVTAELQNLVGSDEDEARTERRNKMKKNWELLQDDKIQRHR